MSNTAGIWVPGLDAERYALVVAPALKVAAALAAKRGDPQLFNDMPAMLTLMRQVDILAHCHSAGAAMDEALAMASRAACLMPLHEGGLPDEAVRDCLDALIRAGEQLHAEGVFSPGEVATVKAWQALQQDQREDAEKLLTEGARAMIEAIDRWERKRTA